MNRQALDELKEKIPLLTYLQTLDWHHGRAIGSGRFLGLCPLHDDHKPSLLVDPHKKICFTATAAAAAVTLFALLSCITK